MRCRRVAITGLMIAGLAVPHRATGQEASHHAGYQVVRIDDASRTRPIQLDVWYPTAADEVPHDRGAVAAWLQMRQPPAGAFVL